MWQLLASEAEVFIHSGYIYGTLLFDPAVKAELEGLSGKGVLPPPGVVEIISENLIYADGCYFIKSLSLTSLVENYPAVFPEDYERIRLGLLKQVLPDTQAYQPPLDDKLKNILFDILPHFLRLRRGLERQSVEAASVLAFLASKIPMPNDGKNRENRLRERETSLRQILLRLEHLHTAPHPPLENHLPGRELARWFQKALENKILAGEIESWEQRLAHVQDILNLPQPKLAGLLAIADRGGLEVEGCGFNRHKKSPGDYFIYKRTGEFALKDYFGRIYLFPDCRVAVSTAGPFHPMVLDVYKHPLLRRLGSSQAICLNDFQPAAEFSAAGVIKALEEGVNALYYGYNSRKRNGYNSLDTFGRHQSLVEFEDLRIARDHPKLLSGEVEVKNDVL